MNNFFLFFPACYFFKTRLNTKSAILFHGYAEYLLAILMMTYAGIPMLQSVQHFLLAYLAFISIYEIGYIVNDHISVRFEKSPRKRLDAYRPDRLTISGWIIIRVFCFLLLTYVLDMMDSLSWWTFYGLLAVCFALHNALKERANKIFTFMSLAFFRFYAPVFVMLPRQFLINSMPAVFICYIFFRTLTYIDSKGLLNMTGRNTFQFKSNFYLYFIPLSGILSLFFNSPFSIYLNIYFLLFWGFLMVLHSMGYINSIKTE